MIILSRDKQIEIIAALTEGLGVRATARLTGVNRDTVATLALRIGRGCAELHDRMMVGVGAGRIEMDELWAFVGKKQKRVERHEAFAKGDQYTFVALASSTRAIITYPTGKRDSATTILCKTFASASWARRKSRPMASAHISPPSVIAPTASS
jgi:hypothetical protein